MKKGRKDKTGTFGTDAEYYAASLFTMLHNLNGTRRPDLLSMQGTFTPKLTIEVKSGRKRKGVLNASQLHYAVTLEEDYKTLFGNNLAYVNGRLPGAQWETTKRDYSEGGTAYYYDVINRPDEVTSKDLDKPFSSIKLTWGDQYLVPHEFGFYMFAVRRAVRTGEDIQNSIDLLLAAVKEDVDEACSHYLERRSDTQGWQNLQGGDILAIHQDDVELTSRFGKKRLEMLRNVYPEVDSLEKVTIPGPNKTTIYALVDPSHKSLFNEQLRRIVALRKGVIERVHEQRKESLYLLDRIGNTHQFSLFDAYTSTEEIERLTSIGDQRITFEEASMLRRLCWWVNEGEIPFDRYYINDGLEKYEGELDPKDIQDLKDEKVPF